MGMISALHELEVREQGSDAGMNSVAEKEVGAGDAAGAGARSEAPAASVFKRLAAIARNAFREAVRDRVLYNLVFFVLLLIAGAIFLGELSDAQESKIIIDMGLSAMLLFGAFIAIFVGVGLVYKEIERRTIYAIFSKPVGRGEFLVGKYLGLCLTLLVNVAVMGMG
ncbi:MAG: ABC transporter permease, partial [Acidobacteria bacterium]|nr:ABC transporter permease [Acidobacteriota bacterium]